MPRRFMLVLSVRSPVLGVTLSTKRPPARR